MVDACQAGVGGAGNIDRGRAAIERKAMGDVLDPVPWR